MSVPKQFVNVFNLPIIVYTLEAFQKHKDIDAIMVACLDGWQEIMRVYAREAGITKLQRIVKGGENGQASARNVLRELKNVCKDDDIIIIHDAIRPLVSAEIISDRIAKCRQYGSGLAAMRCQETIIRTEDGIKGSQGISRSDIMCVQTPQAYLYRKVMNAHEETLKKG